MAPIELTIPAPALNWGPETPYPTRDAYLTRKMAYKEALALSPEAKIERLRASWRVTAKRKDKLPHVIARKRKAGSKREKEARMALRVCKALFGSDWRARVAMVLPQ